MTKSIDPAGWRPNPSCIDLFLLWRWQWLLRQWVPRKYSDAWGKSGLWGRALSLEPGDSAPHPSFSATSVCDSEQVQFYFLTLPFPLKNERFIPKDAGGMASCSSTPWLLIWGKKKQLMVNHRFGIHLLETCQEIRLMTC